MSDASGPESTSDWEPDTALNLPARLVCAVLSGAGVIAGGVAVYKTDNDVGTGSLLLLGTYFALGAILGRFPRLKLGDSEIDPLDYRKTKRLVLENDRALVRTKGAVEDARVEADEAKEAVNNLRNPDRQTDADTLAIPEDLKALAKSYNEIRLTMWSGRDRTARMTEVMESIIRVFAAGGVAENLGLELLSSSDPGLQLAGVAYMNVEGDLRGLGRLIDIALTPSKPFAEYWACKSLRKMVRERCDLLDEALRSRIRARLADLPPGSDRAGELHATLAACP